MQLSILGPALVRAAPLLPAALLRFGVFLAGFPELLVFDHATGNARAHNPVTRIVRPRVMLDSYASAGRAVRYLCGVVTFRAWQGHLL